MASDAEWVRSVLAGRAFAERSGTVSQGYGPKKASKYTTPSAIARADGKKGIGMAGGRSWIKVIPGRIKTQ